METQNCITNIRQLIKENGFITMSVFMENVISHYYKNEDSIGAQGDFITSPEISQLFGEMIGLWCLQEWEALNRPKAFSIVELGPGRGSLIDDVLRSTKHIEEFHNGISVRLVENSPLLRSHQHNKLSKWKDIKFHWHDNLSELPRKTSLFVANEFFDAMPVNQYIKLRKNWYEKTITTITPDGEFCMSEHPTPAYFDDYLTYEYVFSEHRSIVEISPESTNLLKQICLHIKEYGGSALVVDYGYDFDPKTRMTYHSTIQAVRRHKYHPLLIDIGQADITAHVDFYALKEVARQEDCQIIYSKTQEDFLVDLGIKTRLNMLSRKHPDSAHQLKLGVDRLIDKKQMGSLFKALAIRHLGF